MLVAPSVLSVDYSDLRQELSSVQTADMLHIDVMDGHFVPNLTIGPVILEAIKKSSPLPLDIHLMVENAGFFIDLYAKFAPEYISFHLEREPHPHRLIQKIKSLGIKAAVAINPHTRSEALEYLLGDLDMVLIMSVNPGFGGQKFLPLALEKTARLKDLIAQKNTQTLIEVDGGVNAQNAKDLKSAGCDIVVAGSYIFGASNRQEAIKALR